MNSYSREIRFQHKANWGDSDQREETSTGIWNLSTYTKSKIIQQKQIGILIK